MHFSKTTNGGLQFFLVANLLGLVEGVPKCTGFVEGSVEPVDSRCHDVLVLVLLEHVHSVFVDVRRVVDDVDAMLDALRDRVTRPSMSAESDAMSVSFVNARRCLFI